MPSKVNCFLSPTSGLSDLVPLGGHAIRLPANDNMSRDQSLHALHDLV